MSFYIISVNLPEVHRQGILYLDVAFAFLENSKRFIKFPNAIVSPACIPRCQNGGRCLEGNSCRCPTFFTGDHCERFSLKDLLESPDLRERPHRKLQRIVVSEPPDRQILDGTLNLDSGPPAAVEYRDISQYRDLNQDTLPAKEFVAKQQRTESTLPTNDAEIDGGSRRRQLILEI